MIEGSKSPKRGEKRRDNYQEFAINIEIFRLLTCKRKDD